MQPLQVVHPLCLAGLREGLERRRCGGNGIPGIDFIRHGDFADHLVVGRID